ncbi:hypothetical protein KY385_04620 [Candidatus Parcubacteria bacterium]|nr:hypothetical protein [Candidatus Parcubacteria bacterium]
MKKIVIAIVAVVILSIVAVAVIAKNNDPKTREDNSSPISSYQECVDKGYPVQASYPSVCRVPGGQSFSNPAEVSPQPPQTQ